MVKRFQKKLEKQDIMFYALIFITLLLILSPLLLKIPIVKNVASEFLSNIGNLKGDYISMIGGLFGSYLAITGALWMQRRIDEKKDNDEIKKIAMSIIFDMERGFSFIKEMYICKVFNIEITPWNFKISSRWDENITAISTDLPNEVVNELNALYNEFNKLTIYIEKVINTDEIIEEYGGYGSTNTSKENLSYKKYNKLLKTIAGNLGENILSDNLKNNIKNDKNSLNKLLQLYEKYEEDLKKYETENDISNYWSFNKNKFPEDKLTKLNELNQEKENSRIDYINLREESLEKWEINSTSFNVRKDINEKYMSILNLLSIL